MQSVARGLDAGAQLPESFGDRARSRAEAGVADFRVAFDRWALDPARPELPAGDCRPDRSLQHPRRRLTSQAPRSDESAVAVAPASVSGRVRDRNCALGGAGWAVWDIPRLKGDDVLRAVADTGGVIGMSAAPHTTVSSAHPAHSLASVMDHLRYCIDLVGIDAVGLGPDTLFGDHVGLHTQFAGLLHTEPRPGAPVHQRVAWVDGMENPAECFPNVAAWLVSEGFSDADALKVLGGNVLRALRETWV